MPDDNRTQGPSNDAPRDPLDDLIAPILNHSVPVKSTRATARPAASNTNRRDPLDDLLTDADLRTEVLQTTTAASSKKRVIRTSRERLYDRLLMVVAICLFGTAAAIVSETQFGPRNRWSVWNQQHTISTPPTKAFQELSANPKRELLPTPPQPAGFDFSAYDALEEQLRQEVANAPAEKGDGMDAGFIPEQPRFEPKLTPEELYKKVSPSVVRVNVRNARSELIGHGSGFFVRDTSTVVTNFHVVEGGHFAEVVLSDGTTLAAVSDVETFDMQSDVAILRVFVEKKKGIRPLTFSGDQLPPPASKAYVIGSPEGLDNSFSEGSVSAVREMDDRTWIQTTAPISPGSSGSPVFNERGLVIGVATKSRVGGQNLNMAVASLHLQTMIRDGVKTRPMNMANLPSRKPPQRQAAAPAKPADPVKPKDDEDSLKEAQGHIAAGLMRRALQTLDDIPEENRGPRYWRVRATAFFSIAKYQDSAKCYSESLKLDNTHSDTWIRYATALRFDSRSNRDTILAACRAALKIDRNDARAYHIMGTTFLEREEQIDAFKTALSLDEPNIGTHYHLGCELAGASRSNAEASKHFKRALALIGEAENYQIVNPERRGLVNPLIEEHFTIDSFSDRKSFEIFLKLQLAAVCEGDECIAICREVLKSEPKNQLAVFLIGNGMRELGVTRNDANLIQRGEALRDPFFSEPVNLIPRRWISLITGNTGILVFRK